MTLPEIAIRRPIATLMALVCIAVIGMIALDRLPLGFLPEVDEPALFIRVPYANASPEQVERSIVRPLEESIGSVKGLKHMWSWCDQNGGGIRAQFDWAMDMDLVRVEVHEKIDRIKKELPDDIGEISVSSNWDAVETSETVLEARISSKLDLSHSYDLLDRKIIRPLERIPGVAQVNLDGVNPREVRINLRLTDLTRHRVDVRDVVRLLQNNNFDQALGTLRGDENRYSLRTVATFAAVEEIAQLPLNERGLKLRDVADVRYEEPPLEYGRHLDGNFAVGITVNKEPSANAVVICDQVVSRLQGMATDPELDGINILVWFNMGKEIRTTLDDLRNTGVVGAILATIVLYAFLRRLITTLVAVVCIPFSLIATCGVIFLQGKSLNTLTLLGLIVGIGMLVDNAVVVMENIFRYQSKGYSARKSAFVGSREVSLAVTAATLTSVIAFLPLIFNKPSEMNIYLRELGLTVAITLLASLFVTQTLIPLATSRFIRAKAQEPGRFMTWLEKHYVRALGFNLRHRWIAPIVGLGITASAVFPFTHIDMNFDTNESEMFVQVRYEFSEEPSLERKEELVTVVEQALEPYRDDFNLRSIYSFWSDRWTLTRLYPKEGHATEEDMTRIRRRLRDALPAVAGVKLEVMENRQFWRQDRGKRVAFQLTGEDSEVLADLADAARKRLEAIPGLYESFSSNREGQQEVHVSIDRVLAHRYGMNLDQPGQVVGLTFRGRPLRRFRTANGEVEMRLTLDEQDRESLAQLRNLRLQADHGATIPLGAVADFRVVPGAERINRDARRTSVWVGARYEEGTRDEHMKSVRAAMQDFAMPYGYAWSFGNFGRRQQEKATEFRDNLILALLLIFAVMASLFESMRQAVALLIALPFAISGAAWTLYASGTDFDQPAAVGLLLLIGIVVNNGIVMIEHINTYRRHGEQRITAMIHGGRERLRPILMTATTTLLSLVPIVVQKPTLAGVYYYSMALVIMGGLAISTVLTLVLLPTTVTLAEDLPGLMKRGTIGTLRRLRIVRPRRIPHTPTAGD
ncbi:MAG: efflux RND transporter permease subunit [Candidatus Latescibacterota bacterium]|nr:MAG: efflux RND transporter permease subunit [Candidatus Latescibacterota bacterium]